MLLKTIFCKVEEEKRELFSDAQEKWRDLQYLDGFYGQFGGWNEEEACVYTLWKDRNAYQAFMNDAHDTIFFNSNQEGTYTSCNIEMFQTLYDITEIPLKDVIAQGSFVRVAICDVGEGKEKYFLHAQETIWNKGMENAKGILGGVVGKSLKTENRYIVLTYWQDEIAHERYMNEIFPALYRLANVNDYVENINGKRVIRKEEWSVATSK